MRNRVILSPFFLDELRENLEQLGGADWVINKPVLPQGERQERMSVVHEHLARAVSRTIAAHERPVSIAGDCCTAIGFLAGLQRAGIDPYLIWFDAHGDFNTWETTPSGFLGGMPLAMTVGIGGQQMPKAVGLRSQPEERVILTDGRDLDPGERKLITASKMTFLKDAAALCDHPLPDGPIYVHFDTDVVALQDAPAQNYPAQGGPPADLLAAAFSRLAQSERVVGVSISTWNPDLDQDRLSERTSLGLLRTLVGDL